MTVLQGSCTPGKVKQAHKKYEDKKEWANLGGHENYLFFTCQTYTKPES